MIGMQMNVAGRTVVVFGGGAIAYQKCQRYIAGGAYLIVYSSEFSTQWPKNVEGIQYVKGEITCEMEIPNAFIYVCAIEDLQFAKWLYASYGPVSNVMNVCHSIYSNCMHMLNVQHNGLLVSVGSNGRSPTLTKHLGQEITKLLRPYTLENLTFLQQARRHINQLPCTHTEKQVLHEEALHVLHRESEKEQQRFLEKLKIDFSNYF
ncbi:MAG: precorrin-2 dehydrogenase/sirohydrochlorin ferrochelatase family protein [Bacilli bacterium]